MIGFEMSVIVKYWIMWIVPEFVLFPGRYVKKDLYTNVSVHSL